MLGEGVQDPDWTAAPSALHDETYVLSPTILLCSSWSSSSPVCCLSPPTSAKGGAECWTQNGAGPGALQDAQLTPACPAQMPSCL